MKRLALAVLAAASAITASACDNPFSGDGFADTYALTPIGDAPLPLVLWADEYGTLYVQADTFRLRGNGTGEHVRVHWHQPAAGPPVEPTRSEADFGYVVIGDRIEISYPCPPNASCIAPPHAVGRLSDAGLVFENFPEGYVFRRL